LSSYTADSGMKGNTKLKHNLNFTNNDILKLEHDIMSKTNEPAARHC